MKIETASLQAHIRSAKRWQRATMFMFGLCVYIVADSIYAPTDLMIEQQWWQALAVSVNICAAVMNWNSVFATQEFIVSARQTIARIEEWNRVIG